MKQLLFLKAEMQICDTHVQRLQLALAHISYLVPFTPDKLTHVTEEQLGFLELLTSRFAKLQDAIGQKIFPLLLQLLQVNLKNKTFLDYLNHLEKIGALETQQFWNQLREIGNSITHDYPENSELASNALNACVAATQQLIDYWYFLRQYIREHVPGTSDISLG